jgi:hypothetical protein
MVLKKNQSIYEEDFKSPLGDLGVVFMGGFHWWFSGVLPPNPPGGL